MAGERSEGNTELPMNPDHFFPTTHVIALLTPAPLLVVEKGAASEYFAFFECSPAQTHHRFIGSMRELFRLISSGVGIIPPFKRSFLEQ